MIETSPVLAGLNPQQREAVVAVEGPVLILAGAGSGKTRVITHRIAHLVLDRGVDSSGILAVTFTNKAAEQMKARAEALLAGRPLHAWISTFHSFCVRLLRREAAAAGLASGFLIYDEDDQLAAVREAMRALDLSEKLHPPRRLLSRISARKNSGRTDRGRRRLRRGPHPPRGGALPRGAAGGGGARLRRPAAAGGAPPRRGTRPCGGPGRSASRTSSWTSTRTRTGRSTSSCASSPGRQGNLTVVGDEDQSIYSWRGADISNILDFEHDFPGARVFRLEENYRSSQRILDAAGGLVSRNVRRKGKTLRAVKGAGDPVQAPRGRGRVPGGRLGHRARSPPCGRGAAWRCSSG